MRTTFAEARGVAGVAVFVLVLTGGIAPCRAELFSVSLDGTPWGYGGYVGTSYHESPFDFGQQFASVSAAWLHVEGAVMGAPLPTNLRFWTSLDGASLHSEFTEASTSFQHDLPMALSNLASILDGQGIAGLALSIVSPPEPGAGVSQAILWFDAVAVPEPTALCLLALGTPAVVGRRRQAA